MKNMGNSDLRLAEVGENIRGKYLILALFSSYLLLTPTVGDSVQIK